jgi:quercetin dioxygenase-like cupin family protein
MIDISKVKLVPKGWGCEKIIANNEFYCGKLLCYNKSGAVSSAHFHLKKTETFYVQRGDFNLVRWDHTGKEHVERLCQGDVVHIPAGTPHQLTCLHDDGVIFEVSTPHSDDDVVRIAPGDSQKTEAEKESQLRAEYGVYE